MWKFVTATIGNEHKLMNCVAIGQESSSNLDAKTVIVKRIRIPCYKTTDLSNPVTAHAHLVMNVFIFQKSCV